MNNSGSNSSEELISDLEDAIERIEKLRNVSDDLPEDIIDIENKLRTTLNEARDQNQKLVQGDLKEVLKEAKDVFAKLQNIDEEVKETAQQLQIELNTLHALHGDIDEAEELDLEEMEELSDE